MYILGMNMYIGVLNITFPIEALASQNVNESGASDGSSEQYSGNVM